LNARGWIFGSGPLFLFPGKAMGYWRWGHAGATAWDDATNGWTRGTKCVLKGGGNGCLGFEEAGHDSWAYSEVYNAGQDFTYVFIGHTACRGIYDVMVRGSTTSFLKGDANPGWSVYEGPRNYPWRYIQLRVQRAELAFMGRYGLEFEDRTGLEWEDK